MFAKKSHHRPNARQNVRPIAVLESMDGRQYCDGDNSFATAANLGAVDTYVYKTGHLTKNSDTSDFYKFTSQGSAAFTVKLGGLSSNADLYLYDKNKNQIASSKNGGSSSEVFTKSLSAGTYYVEARLKDQSTDYNLRLTSDNVGNSLQKATDLGTVNKGIIYSGYVGTLDSSDYYAFHTAADGTVKVQLAGLSDDANVELLKADGTKIALADNGGTTEEQIAISLPAGKYFAKVVPANDTVNAKYTLTVSGPEPDVGNTRATAKLVTSKYHGSQTVGAGDDYDFYKINVTSGLYVLATIHTADKPVILGLYDGDGHLIDTEVATAGHDAQLMEKSYIGGPYYVAAINGNPALAHYSIEIETV